MGILLIINQLGILLLCSTNCFLLKIASFLAHFPAFSFKNLHFFPFPLLFLWKTSPEYPFLIIYDIDCIIIKWFCVNLGGNSRSVFAPQHIWVCPCHLDSCLVIHIPFLFLLFITQKSRLIYTIIVYQNHVINQRVR